MESRAPVASVYACSFMLTPTEGLRSSTQMVVPSEYTVWGSTALMVASLAVTAPAGRPAATVLQCCGAAPSPSIRLTGSSRDTAGGAGADSRNRT